MGKLYVRERGYVGKGEGRPRFEVVAVTGIDLKVYHSHLRKAEMEKIAADLGADIVYLPRGEQSGEEGGSHSNRGQRRRGGRVRDQD
jgi:hypothetical protein